MGRSKKILSEEHKEAIKKGQEDSFKCYQKQAITAAKQLCYPPDVIEKLKRCTTTGQVSVVMATARRAK